MTEVELKLATDADTLSAIAATKLPDDWQAGPWRTQTLSNRYFDSRDHDLRDRGIALRIRQHNGKYRQTVKDAGSSVGGLHQRHEWESEINGPELDIAKLPETEWTPWLTSLWRSQQLAVTFSTEFERQKREIRHVSGTVVEMALDHGAITANDEHSPINEIELEVLQGDVAPLFALARHLAEHHPLHPDGRSKAERGYRLLDAQPLPQTRLHPLDLNEHSTAWDLLHAAVRTAWSHWQLYDNEFRSRGDVASAEQLRRAAFLLRHTLVFFHGIELPFAHQQWRRMLTKLLHALAWVDSARELLSADDCVHRLEDENYLPCQEALAELLPDERDFGAGVSRALLLLHSREYSLFALDVAQFIHCPPPPTAHMLVAIEDPATTLVVRQWEALQQMWENGPKSPDLDFYRRQHRHLHRAVLSGLLFARLYDERKQNQLLNPCRDLLAGIQDANTLDHLDHIARGLNAADYRDFTGWLVAQRETLWEAMRMTREWALRAEPEDLEN